jgi:alkylated DNA repair dioxygenase AlkB
MQENLFGAVAVEDHKPRHIVDGVDGRAVYYERFLDDGERARLFSDFRENIAWNQETISLYGKVHPIPRLTAWYGDEGASYKYSKISNKPNPWTQPLNELRRKIEAASNATYNSVLLNLYRHGADSVAWHADDERELGEEPNIASISLGAERKFQLRRRTGKEIVDVILADGSLLIMSGSLQQNWLHQIPKQPKIERERINLTFRRIS